jgi:glycosyltransferase involved in cell wall biosynthesis
VWRFVQRSCRRQERLRSTQTINVAHVITRLNVGGASVQVILATEALCARRHHAVLLSGELSAKEGSMHYLAEAVGIPVVTIRGLRRECGIGDPLALLRLIRIFRRERPDIVHTHTAKAGTLGRIAALLTGVPVRVHTFHGNVFHGYFPWPIGWAIRCVERVLAQFTDCLITISESQRRQLAETYYIAPSEKIVSIPLALDMKGLLKIEGFEGKLRGDLSCSPGEVLVGWVGRLTAVKAPELLFDCARLVGTNGGCRFVMVGDGELRAQCEQRLHSLGLESQLTMVGWQRELVAIYADLDLVVLTSINEGTPVTLLETMAAGRPFVATDVGGVRDLVVGAALRRDGLEIFENGILVPAGNPQALADAVRYLIGNSKLRYAMGRAGREFVESRFSPDRMATDLERLYRNLLDRKSAAHERRLRVFGGAPPKSTL